MKGVCVYPRLNLCGGYCWGGYQSSLIVCSISKEQSLRRNRPLSFPGNKVRHAQGWVGWCGGGGANEGTELKATEDWEMETRISSLSVQGGGVQDLKGLSGGRWIPVFNQSVTRYCDEVWPISADSHHRRREIISAYVRTPPQSAGGIA